MKAKGIGDDLDQVDGEGKSLGKMYLTQKLQGTNFRMVGVIDPDFAFIQQYHLKSNILLTLGITVLIGLFVFILLNNRRDHYQNWQIR